MATQRKPRSSTRKKPATAGKSSKSAASKPASRKPAPRKSASRKPDKSKPEKGNKQHSLGGQRPLWSGTLRLALVSVPVKLFAATDRGARISFHQVHEPSGKRVRYQKVVPDIGPVDTDEIVKGFELAGGDYVLLEPDEIDEVKIEAKSSLDLVQFVKQSEIHPIWYDRPYYVVPEGDDAEEAYGVLRDALRAKERVGIGQFVMRGREYIGALKPCGNGLLLETLRFADEVRESAPYFADVDDDKPDKELLDLAEELIDRKSSAFKPESFKDSYTEALRELIEAKAKTGKPIHVDEDTLEGGGGKVIDLVEALKRSVADKKTRGGGSASGGRKKAS
jgi:DNA end-binding protein Ku